MTDKIDDLVDGKYTGDKTDNLVDRTGGNRIIYNREIAGIKKVDYEKQIADYGKQVKRIQIKKKVKGSLKTAAIWGGAIALFLIAASYAKAGCSGIKNGCGYNSIERHIKEDNYDKARKVLNDSKPKLESGKAAELENKIAKAEKENAMFYTNSGEKPGLVELNDSNFSTNVEKGYTVVDFYGRGCGACKTMAPRFKELSEEMKGVRFAKVDTGENDTVSSKYRIRSLPTFVILEDGREIGRTSGASPKNELRSDIKKIIRKQHDR